MAAIAGHNEITRKANPSDGIYCKGQCCLGVKCYGPTIELRPKYVCNMCGEIYHNIVSGQTTELESGVVSSLCFKCLGVEKGTKESSNSVTIVDKVQFVRKSSSLVNQTAASRTTCNSTSSNKKRMEDLLLHKDFGCGMYQYMWSSNFGK